MVLKKICSAALSVVAAGSALSGTAFAASGDFNFTSTLSQGAAGLTTITSSPSTQPYQITSTDAANYFTYTNGTDSGQTDNAAGFAGTSIVLQDYATVAADLTPSDVSDNFIDTVSFTDLNTSQTQTQALMGSYLGTVGSNAASLGQTYTTGTLTFVFSDGTYVVTDTGIVSPGAPGGQAGASGANVKFTSNGAPEPSALALIIPGVLGVVGLARRRKPSK